MERKPVERKGISQMSTMSESKSSRKGKTWGVKLHMEERARVKRIEEENQNTGGIATQHPYRQKKKQGVRRRMRGERVSCRRE